MECRHDAHARNKALRDYSEPEKILEIGGMDVVAERGLAMGVTDAIVSITLVYLMIQAIF